MLRTRLCDLLGIEYPIVQAGMGSNTAGGELAGAVSAAGGLGCIGTSGRSLEDFREQIQTAKRITNKPFGVNLLFPVRAAQTALEEEIRLPDPPPAAVQQLTKELLEHGVDVGAPRELVGRLYRFRRDPNRYETARKMAEIAFEEGVAVIALGMGVPDWLVKECHERGVKVLAQIGSARNAKRAEALGVDGVIAQGHEAGGHPGPIALMVLVPQVVDAVSVPVLAAGGITDGRGLAAVLALGASGVWVGTRFVATIESGAHQPHKEWILKAGEGDSIWTKLYDGFWSRVLRNRFAQIWEEHEQEVNPYPIQQELNHPILAASSEVDMGDYMMFSAGQGCGMITELKSARQVVQEMAVEAEAILRDRLPKYSR